MTRFTVIGTMNYDFIFEVDRFPDPHEKVRATALHMSPGGSAANTAYWIATDGHAVEMVGAVGDDPFGTEAISSLQSVGVDVRFVRVTRDSTTGVAAVASLPTDKRMVTAGGPDLGEAIAAYRRRFDGRTYVHAALPPSAALQDLCAVAHGAGACVSADVNGRDVSLLAPYLSIAFMNRDEWQRLTGQRDVTPSCVDELLPEGGEVVVTLGREGAVSVHGGDVVTEPTTVVPVVDRTGAGDAFNAGFLAARARDGSTRECLAGGLRLARRVVGFVGART